LAERLVRALLVVLAPEVLEASLPGRSAATIAVDSLAIQ
jgi:hypothetical protein